MRVYLLLIEDDVLGNVDIHVFRTEEAAKNRLNEVVDKKINNYEDLFVMRRDDKFASIGYKDWDGSDTCAYYVRVVEKVAEK